MRRCENLSNNSQVSQTEDLLLWIVPWYNVILILVLRRAQYFDKFLSHMDYVGYHKHKSRNLTELKVHYKLSFRKI